MKLSVAVMTLSEPSLTNTGAVLLSHDACTAIIHSQMWVGSDSRAKLAALFIEFFTGIQSVDAHICRGAIDR